MASIESRVKKLEQLLQEKRQRRKELNMNYVFIMPNDEKRYQEYQRYVEAHPEEQHCPVVILPANGRESRR